MILAIKVTTMRPVKSVEHLKFKVKYEFFPYYST